MAAPTLLAIPNVSEGRDAAVIAAIAAAYTGGSAATGPVHLLDVHSDPDHHRTVHTLAGPAGALADAVAAGAAAVIERVDITGHAGTHPHIGALDVAPFVHLDDARRGAACAEALVAAELLGRLGLPVLLYGALANGRRRADLRRGGPLTLAQRLSTGDLRADFGPQQPHPTAGAVLVAARPPLVAFNVELAPPATLQDAQRIAALIREGGEEGLPGLRAIGLTLPARDGVAQVSMNVEDHLAVPLATAVQAVARHARVTGAELVGLAPAAAFDGFPPDVPVRNRRTVAEALQVVGL
ncbi:Glutamate formimidoyltransferase [Paraconexibacter sp. AEG42_29]|uniref:glutamate formimidoyltransferase n=1 Tax=Paraconexibacter sp. AEG42_29 TaxID=2997339 RepID=A0AAU7AX96_9ACTN